MAGGDTISMTDLEAMLNGRGANAASEGEFIVKTVAQANSDSPCEQRGDGPKLDGITTLMNELPVCVPELGKVCESGDNNEDIGGGSEAEECAGTSPNPIEREGGRTSSGGTTRLECAEEDAQEARRNEIRILILRRRDQLLAADPGFRDRKIIDLNSEAVAFIKNGDEIGGIAAYVKLFTKLKEQNLVHRQLYVCHCNRASAYNALGLYQEGLWDAWKAQRLAEEEMVRNLEAGATYVKAIERRGEALLGLRRYRAALDVFSTGLRCDPFNAGLKSGLDEASSGHLRDMLEGRGLQTLCLEAPAERKAITYHNVSAPLHKIRNEDMMPTRLLTPYQAERDHNVKDTYNYMTVQADIAVPRRHVLYLEDKQRWGPLNEAVQRAVRCVNDDRGLDARVLNLGAGCGLHAMTALRAGARHVTACERWLYLAMTAKENLVTNGFTDDQVTVLYKRPSDLAIQRDVPVACNILVVADLLESGLLGSGLIPALSHVYQASLLVPDAIVIPSAATVYCQPVQIKVRNGPGGIKLDAADRHRWMPAYSTGMPLAEDAFVPLSSPAEAFYFNFAVPPDSSDSAKIDFEFERDGIFNAVMFWYDACLYEDISQRSHCGNGTKTLQPAVQFLPGEMRVQVGDVVTLRASHNTTRIAFSIDEGEFINIMSCDASVPYYHFSMLGDEKRNLAYSRAITRTIDRMKNSSPDNVHVLDIGAGMGLFSVMAARAGATSVTGVELHPALCTTARSNVALNGESSVVSIVNRDVGLLERGKEIRRKGCNLVVSDFFDAGLVGTHFEYMLDLSRRNVLQPNAAVIPAAATLYCMGIEALTKHVDGFDVSSINKYRWDSTYQTVRLNSLEHRRLTKPTKVFEFCFDGSKMSRSREKVLKLSAINDGILNAIVFWFDLHLDETESLTSAPEGVGLGGTVGEFGDDDSCDDSLAAASAIAEALQASDSADGAAAAAAAMARQISESLLLSEEDVDVGALSTGLVRTHRKEQSTRSNSGPEEHYWGQALQYLGSAVRVEKGRKVTILAKRENKEVKFALREGTGVTVGRPPWKVEWGGGASVENTHVQRVHYCELLVKDFLMRLRCKRFPPIEKDMKMILAQCGALYLDPAVLQKVYHEFCTMELIHQNEELCPATALEAVTADPLELC